MRRRIWTSLVIPPLLLLLMLVVLHPPVMQWALAEEAAATKPIEWGTDHVEEPLAEYMTGGECLFCHRDYVGPRWKSNPHFLTMREATPEEPAMKSLAETPSGEEIAKEATILLGATDHVRYMKKLQGWGMASVHEWIWNKDQHGGAIDQSSGNAWNDELFNQSCAGCHATAVETETAGFSSANLDCYTCHGILDVEHAADASEVIFSDREEDPKVVAAICGQCHLRGGKAKSTGRPYPTNFIAGDDLLRDYEVSFTDADLQAMDVIDRHVFANSRDVLVNGSGALTCVSCHSVHADSSGKHAELEHVEYCNICHQPGKDYSEPIRPATRHSKTCQY